MTTSNPAPLDQAEGSRRQADGGLESRDPQQPAPPGTPRQGPIRWLRARLEDSWMETRTAKTLVFAVPGWPGHHAGQHVDIKLTAEDGYAAQRSYSVASASAFDRIELTVQTVTGGEVSPYLVETMERGDELELRGPIGGWFRWTEQLIDPVLLVGGGSGIVPLMAMLRQRVRSDSTAAFHMIYTARTPDHLFYANELYTIGRDRPDVTIDRIYTRSGLPDDARPPGRLTLADFPAVEPTEDTFTRVYVCGPSGFVESAAQLLIDRGHSPANIRTERFGPSGG
jgi:ferredoxin-NADP reductase